MNQDGQTISEKDIQGKIVVADFFFTTCPSICPKMTSQLDRVQKVFQHDDDLVILSHTVDPETDSVPVLKEYARMHNVQNSNWHFLTGNKEEIYRLARRSYFAVLDEPSNEGPDFIHTENFVLVDQQGRLRGFYDGTNTDEVNQLIEDIKILQKEN